MKELLSKVIEELEARGCNLKQFNENELRGHCPFHDDEHPSFFLNIETGVWFCFACRPSGEKATLMGLARKLGLSVMQEEIPAFKSFDEFIDYLHTCLLKQPALLDYLKHYRRISDAIIRKAKLGYWQYKNDEFLVIPVFDDAGKAVNAKLRLLSRLNDKLVFSSAKNKEKYRWMTNMHPLVDPNIPRPELYPSPAILDWQAEEFVWMAGGELDALALWSVGIPAVSTTKGEMGWKKKDLELLPRWVVIALDNEEEVIHKTTYYIRELLNSREDRVVTHLLWRQKDVTEVLVANGNLWNDIVYAKTYTNAGEVDCGLIPTRESLYFAFVKKEDEPLTCLRITQFLWLPQIFISLPNPEGGKDEYILATERTPQGTYSQVITKRANLMSALPYPKHPLSPTLLGTPKVNTILGRFVDAITLLFVPTKATFTRVGLYLDNKRYNIETTALSEWAADRTVFVAPDITLPGDGKFIDIFRQSIYSSVKLDVAVDVEALRDFVSKLLHIYPDESLYGVLAWFHASVLSPFVRLVNSYRFPVLFVSGIAGTGKTSIVVELLQNIFAPTPHLPSRQTASTMRKYTNMSSLPLVLDEFTPERWGDDIREAKLFLHSCYEMLFQQVSRSATHLELPFYSYTPLCAIGESSNFITKDAALTDRVFLVTFKHKTEKLDKVYIDTFKEVHLRRDLHAQYRRCFVEFLLANEDRWQEWWERALSIVERQAGPEFSARQKNNFTVITFGWILFQEFAKSIGVIVPEAGDIAHYFFVRGIALPLHDPVARILSLWADEKEELLEEGEDWGFYAKGQYRGFLWINIKSFLDKLRVKYKTDNFLQQKPHEINTTLTSVKNHGHPAIVDVSVVTKTKTGKPIRAAVFDLQAAQKDLLPTTIAVQTELDFEQEGGEEDASVINLF